MHVDRSVIRLYAEISLFSHSINDLSVSFQNETARAFPSVSERFRMFPNVSEAFRSFLRFPSQYTRAQKPDRRYIVSHRLGTMNPTHPNVSEYSLSIASESHSGILSLSLRCQIHSF